MRTEDIQKLYDQGDIYKSEYESWYCTPCEAFWTDRQLVDGKCPDCGRQVHKVKEESYFSVHPNMDQLIQLSKTILNLSSRNPEE